MRWAARDGLRWVRAPGRSRTCDLPLRRRLLYPLSYRGGSAGEVAGKVDPQNPHDRVLLTAPTHASTGPAA